MIAIPITASKANEAIKDIREASGMADLIELRLDLIKDIRLIYDNYKFTTKILVASVRNTNHVLEAAKIGADIATIPYSVFEQLFNHKLTDAGIKKFLEDWEKVPKKK